MVDMASEPRMILVAGAHLKAERHDRPLCYALQRCLAASLAGCPNGLEPPDVEAHPMDPHAEVSGEIIVCSDIWWLNHSDLHGLPTVSVGGPGVNAASAYLCQRLPTALSIEDRLAVQVDLDFYDLRVALWGVDHAQTAVAVDLFREKYLDGYVGAVDRWYGAGPSGNE